MEHSSGEKLIDDYTALEQRGHDAYKRIREEINRFRLFGLEPKCVWYNKHIADGMKALWRRACGPEWDEILPKQIAGVWCKEGATGGKDYLIEQFPTNKIAAAIRERHSFNAVDNPLQGIH